MKNDNDNNFNPKDLSFKKRLFHKKLKRANFETKLLLKNIKKQNCGNELKFYNRARIDIKNFGLESNKIEITEFNTKNLGIEIPIGLNLKKVKELLFKVMKVL